MAADKFNAFTKAKKEADKKDLLKTPLNIPTAKKENKKTMTITITPTNQERLRSMAKSVNMSMSELIAYWIEHQE